MTTSDTPSSDVEPSLVRLRAEIIGTANVSPTLSDSLTDIFFICGDDFYPIQSHRVILRNWSQFFAKVVDSSLSIKGPFPVAPFIVLKEVCGKDLQDIFKFIYNGEVVIERSRIGSLLRTARFLEINQLPDLLEASEELKDDLRALNSVDPVNSEKSAETVEQDKSDTDENATSSNVEKSNGLEERLTRQTHLFSSIFRLPQTIEPFKPEKSPTKPVEQIEIDLTSDPN